MGALCLFFIWLIVSNETSRRHLCEIAARLGNTSRVCEHRWPPAHPRVYPKARLDTGNTSAAGIPSIDLCRVEAL